MERRDYRTIVWILIVLAGLLAFQSISAQEQPVIRIGVLDTEQGAISNGARLAISTINGSGGTELADGTLARLELVIEPPNLGFTLDEAVQRLRDANVIAVLGPQSDAEVLDGVSQLRSLNVPVIVPATGDTIITADASGLLFRSRAQEAVIAQALANYLISEFDLTSIATVQLDIASTAGIVDFTTAAATLGVTPQPAITLVETSDMSDTISDLADANPAVVVAYGSPEAAAELYSGLRGEGWTGIFTYNQAFDLSFRANVPFNELSGVISAVTWIFTAPNPLSAIFLDDFVRLYGDLPGAIDAASFDAVNLIAEALAEPGGLRDNLANAPETTGLQGILNDNALNEGDMSNNVLIVRRTNLGAPEVLAHYQGSEQVPLTSIPIIHQTPTPQPEVSLTVTEPFQNVYTGPGEEYGILGQLMQGDEAVIVGADINYTWVVIDFRGQEGWVLANAVSITGDLRSVPVVPAPPFPTLAITLTPSPVPEIDLIIVSASVSPNPVVPGQNFSVNVTVGNIGNAPAGTFSVAGTFPPNNVYLIGQVPGLGAGQSTSLTLSGILSGTGTYTASLQIDANNQVQESAAGEQNNTYNINYTVDTGVLRQGSTTLNLGDTLDLEGNAVQGDVNWNADGGTLGLKAIFGARLGLLGSVDPNTVTYQMINPAAMNRDSIPRAEMNVGSVVGIITADGHRGWMQVTALSDTQIGLIFRVYNG
ncbi:MAG: ABC transporter substrate-binding protein [Anaerolineae bacterium]|nr:ABC transporter substrate-binding protein [Anaerolineae bacterium]